MPEALDDTSQNTMSRALTLSSERLGVTAKIGIAETEDSAVTPVDFIRGFLAAGHPGRDV